MAREQEPLHVLRRVVHVVQEGLDRPAPARELLGHRPGLAGNEVAVKVHEQPAGHGGLVHHRALAPLVVGRWFAGGHAARADDIYQISELGQARRAPCVEDGVQGLGPRARRDVALDRREVLGVTTARIVASTARGASAAAPRHHIGMRNVAIATMAVIIAVARPARAELRGSSLGQLLHDATSVEIVAVDKIVDGVVEGRVVEAIRSKAKAGDARHVALIHGMDSTAPGDRVLVICDRFQCPRAEAIDHDGIFQLSAEQPNDGAYVWPNVVVRDALLALAAGKPAPDLCMTGTIELLDERTQPTFRVVVFAAAGDGRGTVGAMKVKAHLGAGRATDLRLRLEGGAPRSPAETRTIDLATEHLTRGTDGCVTGSFHTRTAAARTAKGLTRVLAGTQTTSVIARGTLELAKGAPLPAGHHALELAIDPDGDLELTSDLTKGHTPRYEAVNDHIVVGFQIEPDTDQQAATYQTLRIDLGPAAGSSYDSAGVAALFARTPTTAVNVSLVTTVNHHDTATKLGTVTLTYVRERAEMLRHTAE